MTIQNVLDDGEPQTRAAAFAAAFNINAIKTFCESWNDLARDSFTLVFDGGIDLPSIPLTRRVQLPEADTHMAFLSAILDCVVDKILKDLGQLVTVADRKECVLPFNRNANAIGLGQWREQLPQT